jgi:protein-disulfide isomerase
MTLFRALSAASAAVLITACGPQVRDGDADAVAPGAASQSEEPADPRVIAADMARIMGDESASVWLVMASDFQCPACKHWHDSYSAEIERDYVETGKVRFAYINFPLSQHRNARDASEAAMCAAAQGKFWEMHDRIFASQETWAVLPDPVGHFRSLATAAGGDVDAWYACLADNVMIPMIDGDTQRGMTGGVGQTPTFFVGSQVVGGAIPARDLRPLLDSAIVRAGGGSR